MFLYRLLHGSHGYGWHKKGKTAHSMSVKNIQTINHLACLLGTTPSRLTFILYKIPEANKYRVFEIEKKNGGKRTISSPIKPLKEIQIKLCQLLKDDYERKKCSHGFEKEHSFITNAKAHHKSRVLINFDLKSFFESINYGRVRGLFLSRSFNCSKDVATILAQIVCYKNALPQGACTSPIIANMIARRLDSSLMNLAKKSSSRYTRYVDDITISTTKKSLAGSIVESIAAIPNKGILLGRELKKIIENEGFELNNKKTRVQDKSVRQEVTGVIVNEFPNIRREFIRSIRMMLHMWQKFGLSSASSYFKEHIYKKQSKLDNDNLFKAVLIGKITHLFQIRGRDPILYGLCCSYIKLDENAPKFIKEVAEMSKKFKVFIGHASEDKDTVAEPLFKALDALNIKTFYDAVNIKWGDSITQVINKALGEADIFVAVISKSSYKKLWPQKEVNAAINRTIAEKQTFLPIFVGTDNEIEELQRHYSLISDLLYRKWDNNPDELASEIQKIL